MQHLTIFYHFLELKFRFFYFFLSFNITFLMCYLNSFQLIYFFVKPFSNYQKKFIFTDLSEAFYTTLQICLFSSLILIIPLIIYQIWCFFITSCFFFERKMINIFIVLFFIFFCFSCFIIYFLIIPKICQFFFTFEIKSILINLELTARIKSYVNLTFRFFFLLILLFQSPLFILFLYHYKLITSWNLLKNRKYFFFFSFFFGAFFSPPDLYSQFFLAIFLYIFSEFFIWLSFFFDHNKLSKK